MILGNDEQVEVPCGACQLGYEGSKGYITEYEWIAKPVLTNIFAIKKEETLGNYKVEYYLNYDGQRLYTTNKDNNIFLREKEAEFRCFEHIKNHELEQKQKLEWSKEKTNKSYAWHIRYHQREAKECERRLEYHKQQAINCKLRVKTEIKE